MSKGSKHINVFIADDHPVIGIALTHGVQAHEITVVGRTLDPDEVEKQVTELRPDVLVLDVHFGKQTPTTGLELAKRLHASNPDVGIVIYSQFDTVEWIQGAYRAGALAFVPKRAPLDHVATAIKQAKAKRVYFEPEIAERLALVQVEGDRSPQAILDERELEVFRYIAIGLTTNEIAEEMSVSAKTISNTRQALLEKLKVERQADITLLAVEHGLINPVPFTHSRP